MKTVICIAFAGSLGLPFGQSRLQRTAPGLVGKINNRCCAARQSGFSPAGKIIGGNSIADRQVKMGMRVNTARQQITTVDFNDGIAGPGNSIADGSNYPAFYPDIGPVLAASVNNCSAP